MCVRERVREREKKERVAQRDDKKRYMDRDGLIGRLTVSEGEKKKEE